MYVDKGSTGMTELRILFQEKYLNGKHVFLSTLLLFYLFTNIMSICELALNFSCLPCMEYVENAYQ